MAQFFSKANVPYSLENKRSEYRVIDKTFSNMLEYQKMILEKVSFDKALFCKELQKSDNFLTTSDFKVLSTWVLKNFPESECPALIRNLEAKTV